MPLRILISGSGIAGLSAALALRRAGHHIQIFERNPHGTSEAGAAIMLMPNATRPLDAWGLDPISARMLVTKRTMHVRGETLERLAEVDVEAMRVEKGFHGQWYLAHRADLHAELKRMVCDGLSQGKDGIWRGEGEDQGTVRFWLGRHVVAFDPHAPSLTLADETVETGDLVIAADGVHSKGVETVLGHANRPMPQELYNFCYRFLIPTAEIAADTQTRPWLDEDEGRVKFFVGIKMRVVWYACRDNEVQNFVLIFHNQDYSRMKEENWQTAVDKSKLLDLCTGFHPDLLAVVNKANDVKQYPLLYRPPISTWTKGHMALAGDACHPMLPHQGQGGSQAIEDGVALGIALCGATREQIPARLEAYEAIRKNRGSLMQVFSNAGQDEAGLIEQEAAKYIPADTVPKTPEEFHFFNMKYDIVEDSLQKMMELDPQFKVPAGFFMNEPQRGK